MPVVGIGPRCVWVDGNGWRCTDEAEPGTVPQMCEHHFSFTLTCLSGCWDDGTTTRHVTGCPEVMHYPTDMPLQKDDVSEESP
jgi:hypothetical protein